MIDHNARVWPTCPIQHSDGVDNAQRPHDSAGERAVMAADTSDWLVLSPTIVVEELTCSGVTLFDTESKHRALLTRGMYEIVRHFCLPSRLSNVVNREPRADQVLSHLEYLVRRRFLVSPEALGWRHWI